MTSISARHDHDHSVVSATVGVRFESGSPGRCGCSGNALHSTGRKSSDASTCHMTVAVGSAATAGASGTS